MQAIYFNLNSVRMNLITYIYLNVYILIEDITSVVFRYTDVNEARRLIKIELLYSVHNFSYNAIII